MTSLVYPTGYVTRFRVGDQGPYWQIPDGVYRQPWREAGRASSRIKDVEIKKPHEKPIARVALRMLAEAAA